MTVTAPFEFQLVPAPTDNPTTCSNATGLFQSAQAELYSGGDWSGWALLFVYPDYLGPQPGGLWLHASLTIQPTNQTKE